MITTDNIQDGSIRTLEQDGDVPETRIEKAVEARALVQTFIRADLPYRDPKRALVQGLVDGNPPYNAHKLRKVGRADACNVNWGIAQAYLNSALTAFYDIFSEAPTYATVRTAFGEGMDEQEDWSGVITEEFHRLQQREASFNYNMLISQYEMVLYGTGPLVFPDNVDWRASAVRCKNLMVPEHAKSDANLWESAVIRQTMLPHELYSYVRNDKAATMIGWNVEATRAAIMNAHPLSQNGGIWLNWEWHQQNLKNGSYYWTNQQKIIQIDHVYIREFPTGQDPEGKISQKIILENETSSQGAFQSANQFLFDRIGRFDDWGQVIHPMYYDHGGGGEHHSVTGMGVKMYSAMEYQNRLLCNLSDKAFAPKMLFKPTTSSSKQKMAVAHFGDYGIMPAGFDLQQAQVAGFMQDGIGFNREISGIVASNLSQYRENLQREGGNPVTASEIAWRSSEQSKLGKTQLNRYYDQLDSFYAEKYRRAANPNLAKTMPGGKDALEFQMRCMMRGVPPQALTSIESVKATRIVGQGSLFQRQQALEFLLGLVSMMPENGRDHLIRDVIAGRAGQFSVNRYYPIDANSKRPTDQNAEAMQWVGTMKTGVPHLVTPTQNPIIYAQTFLQAGSQALQSVQQGGNPNEVLAFLELDGQAIAAHLQRIAQDPSRKSIAKLLGDQFKQLASLTDQLKQMVMRKAQDEQNKQQQAQQAMNAQQLTIAMKEQETKAKIWMAQEKTQSSLQQRAEKHQQSMVLADAATASDIQRKNLLAESKKHDGST